MKLGKYIAITACILSEVAFSGTMGVAAQKNAEIFVGLGGSYNSVMTYKQRLYGLGTSDNFAAGALRGTGSAAGFSVPLDNNTNTLAPQVQLGYLQHFQYKNSDLLWGAKFIYQYLAASVANNQVTIAQAGSHAPLGGAVTAFTGNYLIETVKTNTTHELLWLAFVGKSFKKSELYLGLGPSLFQVTPNIYNLVGHADGAIPGIVITGTPVSFSNPMWVWGGAAQLGVTYHIDPTWFFDLNYTYASTASNMQTHQNSFNNTRNDAASIATIGQNFIHISQRVIAQSIAISVNKSFDL